MAAEAHRTPPTLAPGTGREPPEAPAGVGMRRLSSPARRAITLAALTGALVTVVSAVPSLGPVRHDLASINPWWALAGVALEIASCLSFLPLFVAFFDEIPRPVARRVAWIEEGSGALLPGGGVTSYAVGGVFLHRVGVSTAQIVARSGGMFWFTSAVNAFVLVLGGVLLALRLAPGPSDFVHAGLPLVIVIPVAVAIGSAPWLVRTGRRETATRARLVGLVDGVGEAWRAARHPSWRLLGSVGYLGFDMAVLFCLFRGLGYHISWGVLILAYLIGYLAAIIPVPSGIGVIEGGLVGLLVLYGAPAATSAAAVLVYHAIAFWIPSLGGLGAWADLTFRRPTRKNPPIPDSRRSYPPCQSADGRKWLHRALDRDMRAALHADHPVGVRTCDRKVTVE